MTGGSSCVPERASTSTGMGHAVASIIHSMAPEAEIGSFRVLDARNLSRTAIIQAGIYEAFRRGYQIVNCSFGCKGLPRYVMPHKRWIDEAYVRGHPCGRGLQQYRPARARMASALPERDRGGHRDTEGIDPSSG